jgi:hypothetical protein
VIISNTFGKLLILPHIFPMLWAVNGMEAEGVVGNEVGEEGGLHSFLRTKYLSA